MRIAVAKGRKVRKVLKIGFVGSMEEIPCSVAFCHKIGLDYVSCSPYRVAIAKLSGRGQPLCRIIPNSSHLG